MKTGWQFITKNLTVLFRKAKAGVEEKEEEIAQAYTWSLFQNSRCLSF